MLRLLLTPKNWTTALLLGLLWLLHQLLPYWLKLRLFRTFGRIAYYTSQSRRHVARVNLALCFPTMPAAEREAMVQRNFEHFFVSFLEIAMSWWGKTDGLLENVEFSGTQHLERAIANGNGIILVGAHFSTIELGAALVRRHIGNTAPLHVVYKAQKNPLFNALILRGRARHVASCIDSKNSRQIIKAIRAKQIVWYAPDHDHGINNAVYAPFFGHPAATLTTTATLARISGAAVIAMGNYRNPDNRGYSVNFQPALENFPGDDDIHDASRVNAAIENAIALAPDQYMWIHRRFKTQPNLPKSAVYGSAIFHRKKSASQRRPR